jgi:hypothetical protein
VCNRLAERAREHFAQANTIMAGVATLSRKGRRASWAKSIALILDGMVARGWQPPRQRVRVSRVRIAFILLRLRDRLMPRTIHIIGAGLAGLSPRVELTGGAAMPLSCMRRPLSRGAAAAPTTTTASA